MVVYLVVEELGGGEGCDVYGVYSSRERAEAVLAEYSRSVSAYSEWAVVERVLDADFDLSLA